MGEPNQELNEIKNMKDQEKGLEESIKRSAVPLNQPINEEGTEHDSLARKRVQKSIPLELQREILFRTTVKSFARSACLNSQLQREVLLCEQNSGLLFFGQDSTSFLNLFNLSFYLQRETVTFGECALETIHNPAEGRRSYEIVGTDKGFVCYMSGDGGLFLWNPTTRFNEPLNDPGITSIDLYGFCFRQKLPFVILASGRRIWFMDWGQEWSNMTSNFDSSTLQMADMLNIRGKHVRGAFYWANGAEVICFNCETKSFSRINVELQIHSIEIVMEDVCITVQENSAFDIFRLRRNNWEKILSVVKNECNDLRVCSWMKYIIVSMGIKRSSFRLTEIHFYLYGYEKLLTLEQVEKEVEDLVLVGKTLSRF